MGMKSVHRLDGQDKGGLNTDSGRDYPTNTPPHFLLEAVLLLVLYSRGFEILC
jgi:hypothetical protein